MRKKAKYLHDAPNEALLPGAGNISFNSLTEARHTAQITSSMSSPDTPNRVANPPTFFPPTQTAPNAVYGVYPQNGSQGQMAPPLQDFGIPQQPISPALLSAGSQQSASLGVVGSLPQSSPADVVSAQTAFGGGLFDPTDPALFNFDLASLNFGNHYGALEFGMLGHMSSGAAEPSPPDNVNSMAPGAPPFTSSSVTTSAYARSPTTASFGFGQDPVMEDWHAGGRTRQGSVGNIYRSNNGSFSRRKNAGLAHGYTIGTGASSLASPNSAASPQELGNSFDGSPAEANFCSQSFMGGQPPLAQAGQPHRQRAPTQPLVEHQQSGPVRRPRDPSSIYETVKSPYSYTNGFHRLTAFLQRRFSAPKRLRIAKALASIRPSFISCTKSLNRDDLIFMEKCFQRTLWEYENLINACGTPTIVCRRTGEVAAVGKEFGLLTGWKKDVLLGREANLNTNSVRASTSGTGSRGGINTPRLLEGTKEHHDGSAQPQPVFLAELLDDDSVIEFYEDFAKLAFGDSRGYVTGRCKLLKYETKILGQDQDTVGDGAIKENDEPGEDHKAASLSGRPHIKRQATGASAQQAAGIAGEASIHGLESQDGKVECSYCWTVKRDVFDIPMIIVMNVSRLSPALLDSC